MKLSTTEEYGLRCLLQVARQAPAGEGGLASIKDVAEAEGLSADYVAKLLAILRRAELVHSERGATGGYRLARPSTDISVSETLSALDSPLYNEAFCDGHKGKADCCVHKGKDCSLTVLWQSVSRALDDVLQGITLADLLAGPTVTRQMAEATHG